jgi:phosphatidate phosphatase APP1
MTDWYTRLTTLASEVEERFDYARLNFKLRRGWLKPIQIQTYRGHGTPDLLMLKGRVLEYKDVTGASESDSVWENILSMYRRFDSSEIPSARLQVRFQNRTFEAQTDNEGYFDLRIEPHEPLKLERVWHEVELVLLTPDDPLPEPVRAVGHVLVPPPQAAFGVISDIDDTIVRTGATDPLTMARIVVLNNPHTRVAFEGVAAFYTALRKGPERTSYNPIFYVSSSPWNLYDLVIDFLNIQGIPLGPLFLRDVGLEPGRLIKTGHTEHKMKQIRTIMDTHHHLPFILIGDSGQEDPEIYNEVVRAYPGRIKAIYIRDVTVEKRDASIEVIANNLRAGGVEMVLVSDTVAAAQHAIEQGFIAASALPKIIANQAQDEETPTVAETVAETVVERVPGLSAITGSEEGKEQAS